MFTSTPKLLFLWVPATLPTKTDLKSYHTFRISELGEGWYVEKGRRYKQTNKPKTPNLSAALKPNSTVLPVKWKVRARKMAQREK